MRKLSILFLFCAFILPVVAFSQDAPEYVYCEIVGRQKAFSMQVTVLIDFGQRMKNFEGERIKDETGKPRVFNSMMDALNFVSLQGWEFVQAYVVPETSSSNGTHYLMKRKFDELDEESKKEFLKEYK